MSLQLDKFEEASLRGSLSRRTYRDPYSSPHFAINPLLRMEFDANGSTESTENTYTVSDVNNKNPITRPRITKNEINEADEFRSDSRSEENISFLLNELNEKINYNPLYETELQPDQDSGTYSIDLSNKENSKKQTEEDYRRLRINDLYGKDDQIFSSNGKRYWTFNGYKFHTFGGIKNSSKYAEDSDEDPSPNDRTVLEDVDFANFKFQTFGGIKRNNKIDGKGLPMYRRVTLRSSSRVPRNFRGSRSCQSEPILENQINGTNENFQEADWLSENSEENDTTTRRVSKRINGETKRRYNNKLLKRKSTTTSRRSSSDDDWEDEEVYVPDKAILRKFLKDASRKVKSRSHVENDSTYFLNTSRRKVFDENSNRSRSLKQRSSDENDSLKLEPPIVPQVVERTFETLRDLRVKKKKSKIPDPKKKIGVRCLTDLTIW